MLQQYAALQAGNPNNHTPYLTLIAWIGCPTAQCYVQDQTALDADNTAHVCAVLQHPIYLCQGCTAGCCFSVHLYILKALSTTRAQQGSPGVLQGGMQHTDNLDCAHTSLYTEV